MQKILVFTGNRAEYGLLFPIIKAIDDHPRLDYELVISGNHLSEEFGRTYSEIKEDNIEVKYKIPVLNSGDTNEEMVETVGNCLLDLVSIYKESKPDFTLLLGDRMETFSCAINSIYMNVPIIHVFGGDKADCQMAETSVRHAITKLSHLHFPTSESSKERVLKLGEESWRVFNFGSPAVDNLVNSFFLEESEVIKLLKLDIKKPIILFTQHSLTMEPMLSGKQVEQSLLALNELGYQTVITYPNNDPGGRLILKEIEKYKNVSHFKIHKNLGRKNYLGLLRICSVVVGNSSSGLLETPIFKKPAVNIGDRQKNRIRSTNVLDVNYDKDEIKKAIEKCLFDKKFINQVDNCENPFGDGNTGLNIAETISNIDVDKKTLLSKKITY